MKKIDYMLYKLNVGKPTAIRVLYDNGDIRELDAIAAIRGIMDTTARPSIAAVECVTTRGTGRTADILNAVIEVGGACGTS